MFRYATPVVVLLATLLAVPAAAKAQGCRIAGYGKPVYHAPVYHAPVYQAPVYHEPPVIATPIIVQEQLAPAYVFQIMSAYPTPQGYYGGHQQQSQPPVAGPQVAPQGGPQAVPPGPPTVRLDPAQLKELAHTLIALKNVQSGDEPPLIGGDEPPAAQAQSQGQARQANDAEVRFLQYAGNACSKCHQGAVAKGGVTLFDDQGYWKPSKDGRPLGVGEIYDSVASHRMPLGAAADPGKRVPSDVLAGIAHWRQQR